MRILFKTLKFEKVCSNSKKVVKKYGDRNGSLIIRRIQELQAAPCLADMRSLPGRCHELTGNRKGDITIDLEHPYRLVFRPNPPPPLKKDGGLDWTQVRAVIICDVEDTHD